MTEEHSQFSSTPILQYVKISIPTPLQLVFNRLISTVPLPLLNKHPRVTYSSCKEGSYK